MNSIRRLFPQAICALLVLISAGTPPVVAASALNPEEEKAAEKAFNDRVEALARFATGISKELNNKSDEALEEFSKSVKADPSNERLTLDVARRLIRKQQVKEAIEILESVRSKKDSSGILDAVLGAAHHQNKNSEKALETSASAIEKDPKILLAHRTLFQIYNSQKKNADALGVLKRAAEVEEVPTLFTVDLAELVMAYLRIHTDQREAERPLLLKLLERAQEKIKRNTRSRTNFFVLDRLAGMYSFIGERDKAEKLLMRLAEQFPDSTNYRRRLLQNYLEANDRKGALIQIEKILLERPTDARMNYLRGALAADDEDWKTAEEYYSKAIRFNEQFERVYYDLAVVHLSQDKLDKCFKILETARKRFKASYLMEFYTALAYSRKKDFANSVKHYTAAELVAKQDEPGRLTHQFYFQMGATYERNQDYARAAKVFEKALEMQPDFPDALNYLGYMWAERGENLEKAKAMIEKAVAAEPENAAFLDSMGWVLYMMGKYHESVAWLEQSVELSKNEPHDDPTLFDHLADAYFKTDNFRKALTYYQKAVDVEAKPEIVKKLEETKKRLR